MSARRRRRRRLIGRPGEDDDPLSSLTNLFDVAMVFAVALMAALVGRFNMSDLLVAENFTVNDPLCIHSVASELSGGDGRTRILQHKIRILVGSKVKLVNQVFPVLVAVSRVVHFPTSVKCIRSTNATIQRQVFCQKVLVHGHVQFVCAEICR